MIIVISIDLKVISCWTNKYTCLHDNSHEFNRSMTWNLFIDFFRVLFSQFRQFFTHTCERRGGKQRRIEARRENGEGTIFCTPPPSLRSLSSSLLAEFSTHMRRKRMPKMFAHALDRPVCHDGDSLHPSIPSFPNVSPSVSLFHDNSIPSLPSSPLSLFRTHARRCCLSSFFLSSHDDTPLRLSLTPLLASPLRLFTRTQDENVKPVLYYSTTERNSTRTHSRICLFRY